MQACSPARSLGSVVGLGELERRKGGAVGLVVEERFGGGEVFVEGGVGDLFSLLGGCAAFGDGVVRCSVVWCSGVRCGAVWCGAVQCVRVRVLYL